jgi:pimeloyl-ACP methyl ester carboxylesterase
MKLDVTIHHGNRDRPVVILIHGLGMDKNFWVNPLKTKVFAKNVPLKIFCASQPRACSTDTSGTITVGTIPQKIDNLWTVLQNKGFNLICWSQRRPVGPMSAAVEELGEIVKQARRLFPEKPVALIGHSRGGLIARKFMEKKMPGISALITLSTPHNGSSLSRLGKYISPLSGFIRSILPGHTHGTVSEVLKNIHDMLEGHALKELMPGSNFYSTLNDSPSKDIIYLSFGGKKTKVLALYTWKREQDKMAPSELLTIPDSLVKILPGSIIPDEIIPGRGDFMVTAKRSVLPWAEKHYNVHANHISITWNRKVISRIVEVLEEM